MQQPTKSVGKRIWASLAAFTAAAMLALTGGALATQPVYAAGDDTLDVSFTGSFSQGNDYTAAAGEQKVGTLTRKAGTEQIVPFQGLRMSGAESGVKFIPSQPEMALGSGQDITKSFKAEMLFMMTSSVVAQTTLFSAGGNMFVRIAGDRLEYGYASNNGGWRTEKQTMQAPTPNVKHLLRVDYQVIDATSTRLTVSIDGQDGPVVQANSLSRMANGQSASYGFGMEVHPDGGERGYQGYLSRARLVSGEKDFIVPIPTDDNGEGEADNCENEAVDPVTPGNEIAVSGTDSHCQVLAKLSAVRPTESQAAFLDAGLTAFLHFGVNTYTDREWGDGNENPEIFQPNALDTDQWAKTLADAGMRYAILTVKHHDGFVLYPSRYTDHDVSSAIHFKEGQGDVLREFVNSAHKYNIKVGVYVSPADSNQEHHGVFGNQSAKRTRTIPTLVENDNREGKVGTDQFPGPFTYEASDYGELFLNTLYEVLTEYGSIDEVWFDGAEGNTSRQEFYDFGAYFDLVHRLQPKALIAVAGPDVRWVGNEGGLAREAEWSPQAVQLQANGKKNVLPRQQAPDLGSTESVVNQVQFGGANQLTWYPAEADVSIRPGWFYHANQGPKSLNDLTNIFHKSYGRNSVLLLNIPPNREGKIDDRDVARLQEFAKWRRQAYGNDVALGKDATVAYGDLDAVAAGEVTDGSNDTAAVNTTNARTGIWTVELGKPTQISAVSLAEPTRTAGQQIESAKIELREQGNWVKVATVPAVGARRIVTLDSVHEADAVRVVVEKARGPVYISQISVYSAGQEQAAREYYIDTNAAKAGDGSENNPIKSLAYLRSLTIPAGSTIYIKRGSRLEGELKAWGYGTAESPITVTTYGEGAEPEFALSNAPEAHTIDQVLEALGLKEAGWKTPTDDPENPDPENPDPETPDPENPDPETPDPENPDPGTDEPSDTKPSLSVVDEKNQVVESVVQGGKVNLIAQGFKPRASVMFTLHSDPIKLGTVDADEHGVARLEAAIPANTPVGAHRVEAASGDDTVSMPLNVTARSSEPNEGPKDNENPTPGDNENPDNPKDTEEPKDNEDTKDTEEHKPGEDSKPDKKGSDKGKSGAKDNDKKQGKNKNNTAHSADKLAHTGSSVMALVYMVFALLAIAGALVVVRVRQK